jgi:hypothetical protein
MMWPAVDIIRGLGRGRRRGGGHKDKKRAG